MKKTALLFILAFTTLLEAQELKQVPMINVSGEGKIKVVPDQALVSI